MKRRVFECRECKGKACRVIQVYHGHLGPVNPCKAKMKLVSLCEIPDMEIEELPSARDGRKPGKEDG